MAGTATVTVTADTGPAIQNTANVFTGVNSFNVDVEHQVIQLFGPSGKIIKQFDLSTVTTFTVTISGLNYAVTIS